MPLNAGELQKVINEALGAKDKDGNVISPTNNMDSFAKGLVKALQASIMTHKGVKATAPGSPGPVSDIEAKDGEVIVLPGLMIVEVTKEVPDGPKISSEMAKHAKYLSSNLKIDFDSGVLKGTSSAAPGTPPVPGVLTAGGGGGKLKGINGKDWTEKVLVKKGNKEQTERIFKAIADYIKDNGEGIYVPGSVTGAFAQPGASLSGGIGVGGTLK